MSRELFYAALCGDAEGVMNALRDGAEPDTKRRAAWNLMVSMECRAAEEAEGMRSNIFRILYEQEQPTGADRITRTRTPLHLAAEQGHYDAAVVLLDAGADPDFADEDGWTPLLAAVKAGDERLVAALLARGARTDHAVLEGETPLYRAAKAGHAGIVRRLLTAGADPNAATAEGVTALMVAAAHGEVTRSHFALFDYDPKGDGEQAASPSRFTPDYAAVLAALLEAGADPDRVAGGDLLTEGDTALKTAALRGDLAAVRLLLDAGASVGDTGGAFATPLIAAACQADVEVCRLLHERGADPNVAGANGLTALLCAARGGHLAVVGWLLEQGVSLGSRREDGASAIMMAVEGDHAAMITLLREAGAEIDTRDKRGRTALMHAARYGYAESVRALIALGADAHARDDAGRTALDWTAAESLTDKMAAAMSAPTYDDPVTALASQYPDEEPDLSWLDNDVARETWARMRAEQTAFWREGAERERKAREAVADLLRAAGATG